VVCLGYDADAAAGWGREYHYDAVGQRIRCVPVAQPCPREPD
jgi:hypothetical protein